MSQVDKEFTGGLEKLGPVEEASDAFEAVGRWWARAVLQSSFDNGAHDPANLAARRLATMAAVDKRNEIEETIGGFAEAVTYLLRKTNQEYISVDYHADQLLMEAASLADMPANGMMTFPWKSHTSIRDGVASAAMGYRAPIVQIFPPVGESS